MSNNCIVLAILCLAGVSFCAAIPTPDPKIAKDFESLLNKFNLTFNGEEYQQRLRAFERKYKDLHEINSVGDAAEWSMEKITGMTPNEFKEKYLGGIVLNSTGIYHMSSTHRPSSASQTDISYSAILLPLTICSIIVNVF